MHVRHLLGAVPRGIDRLWAVLTCGLMVAALGCSQDAGSPTDPAVPDLQLAGTAPPFSQISAGNLHSCGVATDGTGYCWGPQAFGELGDGTFGETRNAPAPIAGGLQFSQVRAGTTHSCGLTTDGRAYCWGENSLGQLGDGTAPAGHNTPVPVEGTRRFTQILVGFR